MKIRGTAMHIAEKYTSLARDAMSSGDSVAAENYLQHAEHYNRIILAAQVQNGGMLGGDQPQMMNGGNNRFNQIEPFHSDQDDGGDEGEDFPAQPQLPRFLERPVYNQNQPQPVLPQNAFHHAQQQQPVQPAAAPAPAQNGQPFAGGDNFPPAPQPEGAGAQRNRRRRRPPIGERFNGGPGGGRAGAPANGTAPAGADAGPDEA